LIQQLEYLVALILAGILVWIACDEIARSLWRWRHERCMRKQQELRRRELTANIEYWQKYDREFGHDQRRIRGESE